MIILSCKEIAKYYYERVIICASKFASHEKVKKLADEYEQLFYSEELETSSDKEDVEDRMWQLYNLAKYKEETDGNRDIVIGMYMQILKLSQREKTIFPNFAHIFEFLLLHSNQTDYLKEYLSYECFILGKHTARNGVAGISPPRREFQKC